MLREFDLPGLTRVCVLTSSQVQRVQVGPAFPTTTVTNARAQTRKWVNRGLPSPPADAQVSSYHCSVTYTQYKTFLSVYVAAWIVMDDGKKWMPSCHELTSNCAMTLILSYQLTAEKRRKTGLLQEQRSCSAPPRRATLPPFTASRTTSWRSPPRTATE